MKKSIIELKGTHKLTSKELKSINGKGYPSVCTPTVCLTSNLLSNGKCKAYCDAI